MILRNSSVSGTFVGLPEGKVFTVTTGPFTATFQITYRAFNGNDVVLTAIDPANPVLHLPDTDGNWQVKRSDADLVVSFDGIAIFSPPFESLSSLTISALYSDHTVTLDLSDGNVIPSGGLTFKHTGTNSPRGRFTILGGDQGAVSYNYINANDGSIVMSNYGTVRYNDLELLVNSGTATDVEFNLPAGPNTVTLSDDGDAPENGISRLFATTIVPTYFSGPAGSLTVNRGNAADNITVLDLPDFNAALSIGSTTDPFAAIAFSGAVDLEVNKQLSASAQSISVLGPLATIGGGIDLGATNGITINASLSTHGGPLKLDADANEDGVGTLTTKSDFFRQSKLDSPTGVNFGQFGAAVAVSGDGNTLIVGARSEEPSGNVRGGTATVFVRSGDTWIVQQQLFNPNGIGGDNFGTSVAVSADGNTAVVGAHNERVGFNSQQGTATVFVRNDGVWTVQQKLTMSSGERNTQFGFRVALSGDGNTAVFGVDSTNVERGSLVIFTRTGNVWTERQQLTIPEGDIGDQLGISVAVSRDGSTIVGGAYLDDVGANVNQGSAYVFVRSGGAWTLEQQLKSSDGAAHDWFGWSVALSSDGNTALVGAKEGHLGSDPDRGFVSVFTRASGVWTEQQQLTSATPTAADRFGADVAISGDGNTAVVTAEKHAATVFTRSSGTWMRQPQIAAPGEWVDLSNDGDVLLVGNSRERVGNDFSNNEIGRSYVLTHPRISGGDGTISVSGADMQIGGPMNSGGTVTLGPSLSNRAIALGSTTAGELGLTDAELDLITAGTLQIGDGDSGPIHISADITRATRTHVVLASGDSINFQSGLIDTAGGNLQVSPASSAALLVGKAGTDVNLGPSGTLSFASGNGLRITIDGLAVDADYDQLNVAGQVDLTSASLMLSGSYNPAFGDAFVIVSNDGADAVIGAFSGLPEGQVLVVQPLTSESFSGAFSITYHGGDGNDVVLTAVNAAPTFVVGADQIASHDSGPQTIASWATSISPGLPGEAGQKLHFVVTENTNPGLFAALPTIDATGNLAFAPAPELNGSAQITIVLSDDGGTANGGADTSAAQTFTIYVAGPNRWHNTTRPMDVDGDGQLKAGDALEIINFLNAFGAGSVPSAAEFPLPYYDVSNDEVIAANDALDIINYLNAYGSTLAPTAQPEGEAANIAADNSAAGYESDPDWLGMLAEDVASSSSF